jgi:hypothetical protein
MEDGTSDKKNNKNYHNGHCACSPQLFQHIGSLLDVASCFSTTYRHPLGFILPLSDIYEKDGSSLARLGAGRTRDGLDVIIRIIVIGNEGHEWHPE